MCYRKALPLTHYGSDIALSTDQRYLTMAPKAIQTLVLPIEVGMLHQNWETQRCV